LWYNICYMKNKQKGSVLIIIVIVFLVLLIITGVLFFMTSSSLDRARQESALSRTPQSQDTQNIPSGWKQYTDEQSGFSVAYPSTWIATTEPLGGVTISTGQQNVEGQNGNMIINSSWKLHLGKTEDSKVIDPLTQDLEKNSNMLISKLKALKTVRNDSRNVYGTTINFIAHNKYNLITESWTASGNTDLLTTEMKTEAVGILTQITSSIVIK
jgi:hypothetical protein